MTLDLHDQVSATRTATHAAAKRARETAHNTADVVHAIDLHEPAQAAKAVANRAAKKAAKQAAKATGRAAGRRSKRGGRGLRMIAVAAIAGGLMALAFVAVRRMRATSSATPTNAGFDRFDPTGDFEGAEPEAHSETSSNGTPPASPTAKSTTASNH
jgi:hypothetical protein